MTTLRAATCSLCFEGLEHCHGVALTHLDGTFDCSDDSACIVIAEAHAFRVDCDDRDCAATDSTVSEFEGRVPA